MNKSRNRRKTCVGKRHRLRASADHGGRRAAIHEYDEHFQKNGYSVQMFVFDDSTRANVEEYLKGKPGPELVLIDGNRERSKGEIFGLE